jgi:hypothetical protein
MVQSVPCRISLVTARQEGKNIQLFIGVYACSIFVFR